MATKKTTTKTAQSGSVKEETIVKTEKPARRTSRRIPLDVEVPCISNVTGSLVYKSARIGGSDADWEAFGSLQYLDVRELLLMRNTQKRFFDDNWISIKDTDDGEYTADDIYKFLRVDDRYGDFYDADNIESFFTLSEKQMNEKVTKMSKGMKDLLAVMALDKIERGEIDSIKKRTAIVNALGLKIGEEE